MANENRARVVSIRVGPRKPDIRIVRLVVSIAKCGQLQKHYFNVDEMQHARRYVDIDFSPDVSYEGVSGRTLYKIEEFTLEEFLDRLHRESERKFAAFMTYTLRGILLRVSYLYWTDLDKAHYRDFLMDLKALGYQHDSDGEIVIPVVGTSGIEEERIIDALSTMLQEVSPEFSKMRIGAWEALLSKKADSDRQAISSCRELLRQTIDAMGKGKTRKEKVSNILEGADSDTVDAAAELVESLYALQSKGEHKEPEFERALFLIKLTEYILYYLLKSRKPHT